MLKRKKITSPPYEWRIIPFQQTGFKHVGDLVSALGLRHKLVHTRKKTVSKKNHLDNNPSHHLGHVKMKHFWKMKDICLWYD